MKTRNSDKIIRAKTTPLAIQIYGQVIIKITDLNKIKLLIFYDIAYILGFFINLVSAKRAKRVNIYINIY